LYKSRNKKAKEIHEYFVKLEEILHETMEEESNELKMQLENAKKNIQNIQNIQEKIKRNSMKN